MLVALIGTPAGAQLSPGPLARPHEELEGSTQCLRCHDGKGVAAAKCLTCHTLLGERVKAGRGLHARAEYRDCKRCHIEHQGRAFELVYWGERGRDAFDHALSGFALQGKHAGLRCDTCHRERVRLAAAQLAAGGAVPARTYLGLGTSCAACHADEHRGQFAGRDCTVCHGQQAWKPAAGFDHATSAFPLTGRHAGVSCAKCHADARDPSAKAPLKPAYRRYVKLEFRECASCHRDPHAGRFGGTCAKCHSVEGWRPARVADFDHERTDYPLRGRHRAAACASCHRAGRAYKGLAHARCADCHADEHLGQLGARADGGRCESCHDVQGFTPARFGPEEHARTPYALLGAHLAVACDACHRRVAPGTLARAAAAGGAALVARKPGPVARFRFASTRCTDCHKDAHAGELDRHVRAGGCEACHRVEGWRQASFDHARTRFTLSGAHARVACQRCHTQVDAGTPRARVRYQGLALACEGCHEDPHQGQLTRAALPSQSGGPPSPCERCHTSRDWRPSKFDHGRDARYALDGAHVRLACEVCHKREGVPGGATLVRYRPLPTACKDCHGAPRRGAGEGIS